MKIAILGSAGSSLPAAPFKNERYHQWVEGKLDSVAQAHGRIAGEFEIWGCSPGCWAVVPRASRWFEVHRWEPGAPWLSNEYCQFLRDFPGPVYTGGKVPEIKNHLVYPVDYIEEKFSSYFLSSSLSLMLALAIDTIERIRRARDTHRELKWMAAREADRIAQGMPEPREGAMMVHHQLPEGIDKAELEKDDSDDVIGLWGVDMAAGDEYAYQRPGCQFLVLEAMRRGIGVFLPPESDLMRPMPVYGVSEWDHNYIKLTSRARELSAKASDLQRQMKEAELQTAGLQGEQHALNYFVSTWCSPYGMLPGMVLHQVPGTGLGSGITSLDGRPVERIGTGLLPAEMVESAEAQQAKAVAVKLGAFAKDIAAGAEPGVELLDIALEQARTAREHSAILQPFAKPGESTADILRRLIRKPKKAKRRGR